MLSRNSMYFKWPFILFFLIAWPIAGYITLTTYPNPSTFGVGVKFLIFFTPALLSALQVLRKFDIIKR
jgi:hypothetical protein